MKNEMKKPQRWLRFLWMATPSKAKSLALGVTKLFFNAVTVVVFVLIWVAFASKHHV
jgi:hypothetical protein